MFIQNNVIIYFASKLTAIIIRKIKERETGRKNFFFFETRNMYSYIKEIYVKI